MQSSKGVQGFIEHRTPEKRLQSEGSADAVMAREKVKWKNSTSSSMYVFVSLVRVFKIGF